MKPHTFHFVITVENSISIGRHFYCASTTLRSVIGIVHTFLMEQGVTNVVHDNVLQSVLRRMMGMWHIRYNESSYSLDDHHTPDVSTTEGFLDFVALGTLLELGRVLDRRTYSDKGINKKESAEILAGRRWFRMLQPKIARQYVFYVGNRVTNVASIIKRFLVELAASVVTYKRELDALQDGLFSDKKLMGEMKRFFRVNYKELLWCFLERVERQHKYLSWSGDAISIRKRTSQDSWNEYFNFTDFDLYDMTEDPIPSATLSSIPEEDEMDVDDSPDAGVVTRSRPTAKPRSYGPPVRSSKRIQERASSVGESNICM
jgi:hypothetical protein